jgi:hypothetical protein
MKLYLFFLLFFSLFLSSAQNKIEIKYHSKKELKSVSINPGETIECKLKGQITYSVLKIKEIRDSSIVLSNDSSLLLAKIKKVKLRFPNKKAKVISNFLVLGGVLLSVGDAVNNSFNENPTIVNPGVQGLAVGIVAAGIIVRKIGVKTLKIGRRASITIIHSPTN